MEFTLANNLIRDVLIGLKLLKNHCSITLEQEGKQVPLNFGSSVESKLSVIGSRGDFPTLFPGLNKLTVPI